MLCHLLEDLAPGDQFGHPDTVLFFSGARIVVCQVVGLPRAESRADFVPVVHCRAEVAQHASLEVAELTDFKWQGSCRRRAHEVNLKDAPCASKGGVVRWD